MYKREELAIDFCRRLIAAADELRETVACTHPTVKCENLTTYTISQERLLKTVSRMTVECEEGVPLKEIADRLNLSPSAVSVMVDTLVNRNALERNPSSRDRRVVLIRLSDNGRRTVSEMERAFAMIAGDFLFDVPFDLQQRAVFFLEKFTACVKNYRAKNKEESKNE